MYKPTDKYLEQFEDRKVNAKQSEMSLQAMLSLAIDRGLPRDEIAYALGYPTVDHEFHAIKAWVADNYALLSHATTKQALPIIFKALSHKLDMYFTDCTWHCPDQYQV
ncbi:MAG: hypothetical protein R8K49_00610 [Mariprofundaceae bacterium]